MTANPHILWRHPKPAGDLCADAVHPATETLVPLRGNFSDIEKCLPRRALIQLVGDHIGEKISCLNGVIWITQSGNPEDILLSTGDSYPITQSGTLLIQGLAESRLKITRLDAQHRGGKERRWISS